MRIIAGILVALTLWIALTGWRARASADAQREALLEQTTYLCSTTHVLDALVVAARDQIQLNFDNGTYSRLLRQGVLTRANLRAARATLQNYEASHRVLSRTTPCQGVE